MGCTCKCACQRQRATREQAKEVNNEQSKWCTFIHIQAQIDTHNRLHLDQGSWRIPQAVWQRILEWIRDCHFTKLKSCQYSAFLKWEVRAMEESTILMGCVYWKIMGNIFHNYCLWIIHSSCVTIIRPNRKRVHYKICVCSMVLNKHSIDDIWNGYGTRSGTFYFTYTPKENSFVTPSSAAFTCQTSSLDVLSVKLNSLSANSNTSSMKNGHFLLNLLQLHYNSLHSHLQ